MGRAPCCEKMGLKKGPWTPEEDKLLVSHIEKNGHSNWRALPKLAGLLRCGKSCRLRWINYLRPDIKRGNFTREEEDTIIKLHDMLGNRWSAIAGRLPGRTDNEIKNVWHTHLKKRLRNNPENGLDAKWQTAHKSAAKSGPSNGTPTSPLALSEATSVSDGLSTVTVDASYVEIKSEEMELIEIPEIDESFWSTDNLDSFSIMDDNLLSDSSAHDFPAPMSDGTESEFRLLDSLLDFLDESPGQIGINSEENYSDFWYDLLIRTGGVPELSV